MAENHVTVLDEMHLPQGLEIDLDEGWRKLISRQFGGDPGRAFGELIQNAVDSYPSRTSWEDRRGEIETSDTGIAITDYGEGMSLERVRLLVTLGGTDKKDDPGKIGRFGIGFFSIFNPQLRTREVKVTTRCEGYAVELLFTVVGPEQRPRISWRVLETMPRFSTRIEVSFGDGNSVRRCMAHATKSLNYCPCRFTIDGGSFVSIWQKARESGATIFQEGYCHGFLKPCVWRPEVTLLCKYEYLVDLSVPGLVTGGHGMTYDLQDYHRHETPYVPGVGVTLNCNNLSATISRDGFWLDSAYREMRGILTRQLKLALGRALRDHPDSMVISANQYILRKQIKRYLEERRSGAPLSGESDERAVIRSLAEAKVYKLTGRRGRFSLADLDEMHDRSGPLFFSPDQTNLRWIGGAFKHEFIVRPDRVSACHGAPDFYGSLFGDLFGEAVNLDTIREDTNKIKDLVDRGIADKTALSPRCSFIGARQLTSAEKELLREIDGVLRHETVKAAIRKNVFLPVARIGTAFFEMEERGAVIATGLFDEAGRPLEELVFSNVRYEGEQDIAAPAEGDDSVVLGLRRDHPFIRHLVEADDPHRAYYALTFLAHELALCQKVLVPYSPFFQVTARQLAAEMRRALTQQLISARGRTAGPSGSLALDQREA